MKDDYCSICDETIKLGYEKKHNNSKTLEELSEPVINNYYVQCPELDEIENILKQYANNHDERLEFYIIKCKFESQFENDFFLVKSKDLYSSNKIWEIEKLLKSKIEDYEKQGHELSHIRQMTITFRTKLDLMTIIHFLQQPMPSIVQHLF